jgi:hypothetical protein
MEREIIERTFGDKTYKLPKKIPYSVLKWFNRMGAKDNPDQMEIMEGLLMRLVIEPPITQSYFDDDIADIDDYALGNALMMDILDAADERVYTVKKKLR